MSFWQYITQNSGQIFALLLEHIELTVISVTVAILVGVPLGILISYNKKLNKPVLGAANIIQAIPSLALLGFAIPFLGIGTVPAVTTVVLYSLLPIIKNTHTGLGNINPQTLESARGIGLTPFQVLRKIQIPLALPVIMAGVRISAVTAVGLMTIAAFIGAGGLGFLVFSGIRTVNNNQILAGAIPACLLALFVDFIFSKVEKLVTPFGMQQAQKIKQNKWRHFKWIIGVTIVFVCAIFAFSFINGLDKKQNVITVAGKDYSEQLVLVHLVADFLEANIDISVNRRPNLGGTQVCFLALKNGDIDLYVDYSGTAYGDTLAYPPINDMEKVYNVVKQEFKERFDIDVLAQMAFSNTYTLAVKPETSAEYNLQKISDFINAANKLRVGATLEFLNREDGLPGIQKLYGFKFKETMGLDGSQRYIALMNNNVDVIDAFSTDGLLKKFNLITLEDDLNFFPPYYAIPLVRGEVLVQYPELVSLLAELGAHLTVEIMIGLNYQVDELQQQPRDVARAFLIETGLIPE